MINRETESVELYFVWAATQIKQALSALKNENVFNYFLHLSQIY